MNVNQLSERIKQLAAYKEEKRRLADIVKENNALLEQAEQEVIAAMLDMAEAAGVDLDAFSVKVDGRKYGVIVKPFFSIRAEDREVAFPLLKSLGLGDIVVEKVDDRTLTKALTEIIDENDGALPDSFAALPVSRFEKTTISDVKVSK